MQNMPLGNYKTIYIIVKSILLLTSSFAMLFAIAFNMVSKDQLDKLIAKDYWSYFLTKFLFGLTVGFIFYILSLLANLVFSKRNEFQKQTIFKLALIELAYLVVFSATVTTLVVKSI
jgi:hypothetical protein